MPKFKVDIVWSGYCRGIASYEVEAMDKDEAAENWWDGKEINRETIRDDTDSEVMGVELIEEPKINRATNQSYIAACEEDIVNRNKFKQDVDRYRTKVWNLINKLSSDRINAAFYRSYIKEIEEVDEELH